MADLTSRLRDIIRSAPRPAARELTYVPDGGYEATADPDRICDVLGATMRESPSGPCLVVERRYEADRWHGDVRVEDCEVADDERLRLLDAALEPATASGQVLFLDTETTGLSGGAGTVAFLVGCGWFDAGAFQTRQLLLPSFACERALLGAVTDTIAGVGLIVTYNGKTFDLPLMETRWLFHRMPTPLGERRHFDMLHPARRLWRRRAPAVALDGGSTAVDRTPRFVAAQDSRSVVAQDSRSVAQGFSPVASDDACSLGALERALFGYERVGDVPGFEVPSRYFQYLRSGDPRPLVEVLEHNRLDLISLAAVVARAQRLVAGGAEACRDAYERLALGRLYERGGRREAAEACFRRAADEGEDPVRAEALLRLAWTRRRERRHGEAAEACRAILQIEGVVGSIAVARRYALQALAIHHEHRDRDLETARAFAVAALEADERPRWRDEVQHRLTRLDRKLTAVHGRGGQTAAPLLREES